MGLFVHRSWHNGLVPILYRDVTTFRRKRTGGVCWDFEYYFFWSYSGKPCSRMHTISRSSLGRGRIDLFMAFTLCTTLVEICVILKDEQDSTT